MKYIMAVLIEVHGAETFQEARETAKATINESCDISVISVDQLPVNYTGGASK